jgi:hypothetical protein
MFSDAPHLPLFHISAVILNHFLSDYCEQSQAQCGCDCPLFIAVMKYLREASSLRTKVYLGLKLSSGRF